MFTLGGLETLPTGEVLNKDGEVIPKLYAAGRTTAGLPRTGKGYASGMSVGDATFFGRMAGILQPKIIINKWKINGNQRIKFKNKVALITGGAGGIGKSIVENFAHYGASVVVADKSSERCEELQQILKKCSEIAWIECIDVTQKNEVKNLIKLIETQFNRLDIVVNNVGDFLELIKPFEELDDSEIEDLYSVNLKSMFMVTSEALPLIKNNVVNSSIINISSIEAFRGIPRATVYSSFKHAITGFTRSLALELKPSQIKVNAIAPETTEKQFKCSQKKRLLKMIK